MDETISAGKFKVCLDYHIGKCQGPCEGLVSQAAYRDMIEQVMQDAADLVKVTHELHQLVNVKGD